MSSVNIQAEDPEIKLEIIGGGPPVLMVDFQAGPRNALLPALRQVLLEVLDGPGADLPIVLAAGQYDFSSATYLDHGAALYDAKPSLAALCHRLETHPHPVIAVLSGRVAGPGAELALAAHGRVAGPRFRLTFPEVGLGLSPAAGSTQRLPRLVGAEAALRLLLQAPSVEAAEALALGLVDLRSDDDPRGAALRLARAETPPLPSRLRQAAVQDGAAYVAAVAAARQAFQLNSLPAPQRLIEAVEAALYLPGENGDALEAVIHEDLRASPESHGLIAAAQSERFSLSARRSEAAAITVLGLVGSKAAQAGLAMLAIGRGIEVIWHDSADPGKHQSMAHWLRERLRIEAEAGRISAAAVQADLGRLTANAPAEALTRAQIILRAEAPPAGQASAPMHDGAVTLVMGITPGAGLAALNLHNSGRGAEIGPEPALSAAAQAVILQLLHQLDLQAILMPDAPIIGRNLWAAGRAALLQLVALGVPADSLHAALLDFGQSPYDLGGHDQAQPSLGEAAPRSMPAQEIVNRWLGAMAAEGLRLIAARKVTAPAVIDHIMVQGYDFPRWRGGPMYQAHERGLMVLRADLRRWQAEGRLWSVPPILDRMIAEDLHIPDLNGL